MCMHEKKKNGHTTFRIMRCLQTQNNFIFACIAVARVCSQPKMYPVLWIYILCDFGTNETERRQQQKNEMFQVKKKRNQPKKEKYTHSLRKVNVNTSTQLVSNILHRWYISIRHMNGIQHMDGALHYTYKYVVVCF